MNHTLVCSTMALENKSWYDKWPKACTSCGGTGSWSEPAHGYEPPDGGPCPKCAEQDKCPRCGEELLLMEVSLTEVAVHGNNDSSDYGLCVHCGWNSYLVENHFDVAYTLGMVMPHLGHECECWLRDEPGDNVDRQEELLADFSLKVSASDLEE